jgi:hypothetical protein
VKPIDWDDVSALNPKFIETLKEWINPSRGFATEFATV